MLLRIISKSSFILAGCLVYLVPFDSGRNIDLQSRVILLAGLLSSTVLVFTYRQLQTSLTRVVWLLLFVIIATLLISSFISPEIKLNFFGLPYVGVGAFSVIASLAFALHFNLYSSYRQSVATLYVAIVAVSAISIPYALLNQTVSGRLGGVFMQPDIMACIVGCGLLFGVQILSWNYISKNYLYIAQLFLAVTLLVTETRAVIYSIIVFFGIYAVRKCSTRQLYAMIISAVLAVVVIQQYVPSRLVDVKYVTDSVAYRLSLQEVGLIAAFDRPFIGSGIGSVPSILDCSNLQAESLQMTCSEGYYFNSTHNIFLDRILAAGMIGGICIILLNIYAIAYSFSRKKYVFCSTLALITVYYLTNVHNATLDLLYWIILVACLRTTITDEAGKVLAK